MTPEAWRRTRCAAVNTLIGAMMVRRGDADGMLCGTFGNYSDHLRYIEQVIGLRAGARRTSRR